MKLSGKPPLYYTRANIQANNWHKTLIIQRQRGFIRDHRELTGSCCFFVIADITEIGFFVGLSRKLELSSKATSLLFL